MAAVVAAAGEVAGEVLAAEAVMAVAVAAAVTAVEALPAAVLEVADAAVNVVLQLWRRQGMRQQQRW